MGRHARTRLTALAGLAVLAAAGGSVALAGSDPGSPGAREARCQDQLAKIAARHGIGVAELQARIEARLLARIEAAERSGRIGAEQAATLRARVRTGSICAAFEHAPARRAARGALAAAAEFLGLSKAELRAQLPGTSLAALAERQGKSVTDLKAAMLAPAKERLAAAVAAGRITQERSALVLARLEKLVDRLAQRVFPTE